jgi:type I restriction enzyme M protein
VARDEASLDVFWLADEALEDSANLPAPEVIAAKIVADLRAALAAFEELEGALSACPTSV